jgi:hypothetical protein
MFHLEHMVIEAVVVRMLLLKHQVFGLVVVVEVLDLLVAMLFLLLLLLVEMAEMVLQVL